ncbi:uncharacterized protein LOC113789404 [Dermatophagoides pteronyssinus]|uniref:uncharacterized protein LOC113789404 n=1 Tax=Dermatophagoides pteronyssinus TaxID=6956 RepID=UPI003F663E77
MDDDNVKNLVKQFQAEQLPSEIINVLSIFFDSSVRCDANPELSNTTNKIELEPEKPAIKHEIKLQSIVDQTSTIPENFDSCTEFYDEYFSNNNGCCCSKQCYRKFSKSIAFKSHLDALALDKYCPDHVNHQHLLLLGAMNSLVQNNHHRKRKHKTNVDDTDDISSDSRTHTNFQFRGQEVCRSFFLYVFGCGNKRFKNIIKHFISNGIDSPRHESIYNNSQNKISMNRRQREALIFIQNYGQQNSLQIAGCFSSESNYKDLYLLPNNSNQSRRHIYEQYSMTCLDLKVEPLSFALWQELWNLYYPNIQTFNDRCDPCFQCRQYQQRLIRTDLLESSKLESLQKYLSHLNHIQPELNHFQSTLIKCQTVYDEYIRMQNDFSQNLKESFRSTLKLMHYTFGWFTTISLPFDSQNPRIYFKNGYKVALFGIVVEPLRKFILYIVPEFICHQTDNLINISLSLLHHFFSTYRFGEHESIVHLANGQLNHLKNSSLLSYLMWRTLIGKHDKFQISSLPIGHSHCWNDLFMGVLKKKFRSCRIDSLTKLKMLADRCCLSEQNNIDEHHIQTYLVGNDCGQILLDLYDWKSKLSMIQKIDPNILNNNNHFEIGIDFPGFVLCRKTIHSNETTVSYRLVTNECLSLITDDLPSRLELQSLSSERLSYIFDAIRPFVSNKDSIILKMYPDDRTSTEDLNTKFADDSQPPQVDQQSSKKIRCSYCKQFGHREMVFGRIRCPIKRNDSNLFNREQPHQDDATVMRINDSAMIESSSNNETLTDDQTQQLLAILEMNEQNLQINDEDDND